MGPRFEARHRRARRAASAAVVAALLATLTAAIPVGGATAPKGAVTATGSVSCASVAGDATFSPPVTDAAGDSTETLSLTIGGCTASHGSTISKGTFGATAVLTAALSDVSCSSLVSSSVEASVTGELRWSGSSLTTPLRRTALAALGETGAAGTAGRLELSLSGLAAAGSFAGSDGGRLSTLRVDAAATPAAVQSSCDADGLAVERIASGAVGVASTSSATFLSGQPGNVNGSHQDLATSLCVEPSSGVTLPLPTTPATWPSSIAVSPTSCLAGAPTNPYVEPHGPWATAPNGGAAWVGTDPTGAGGDNYYTGGDDLYDYDVEFSVPACVKETISVSALADNAVAGYLDDHLVAGQASTSSTTNFQGPPSGTPLTFPAGVTAGPGAHVLDFIVDDTGTSWTGLSYQVHLTPTYTCGGTLTLCKVGGQGIAPNTPFTFHVADVGVSNRDVTVDAGAGPTGDCELLGTYPAGAALLVAEVLPPGDQVSSIVNSPPGGTQTPASGDDAFDLAGNTTVTFTDVHPPGALSIVKSVEPTAYAAPGTVLTYTYTVTNTGSTSLSAVAVADPLGGLSPIVCQTAVSPNLNVIPALAPSASAHCTAQYAVTPADLDDGAVTNVATASGTAPGGTVTATTSAVVPAVAVPQLSVEKTASPTSYSAAGTVITYSFLVTNTGNLTVSYLNVVDAPPLAVTCPAPFPTLAPGASVTCTGSQVTTANDLTVGHLSDQVTVTGVASNLQPVSSTATWSVPAAGSAFTCKSPGPQVFLSQTITNSSNTTTPTALLASSFAPGGFGLLGPTFAPATYATYNALGFDSRNRYLYAMRMLAPSSQLLKIDATGHVVAYLTVPGMQSHMDGPMAGSFDGNGNYYIAAPGNAYYAKINPTTGASTWDLFHVGIGGETWQPQDWALVGPVTTTNLTYLWGATATRIFRADVLTGVVDSWPTSLFGGTGTFGAAWTFGNGNLGLLDSATGTMYQVAVRGAATAAPAFSLVDEVHGPTQPAHYNDGAATSCASSKGTNLTLTKTGPATVAAGGTITWVLTVGNNSTDPSSGYVVEDPLPAGVTGATTPTPGCAVSSGVLTCIEGYLGPSSTFAIIVTATAPEALGTCVTNTAEVVANEFDPMTADKVASATTCTPPVIHIGTNGNERIANPGSTVSIPVVLTNAAPATLATGDGGPDFGALGDVTLHTTLGGTTSIVCPGTGSALVPILASGSSVTCHLEHVVTTGDVERGAVDFKVAATSVSSAGQAATTSSKQLTVYADLAILTSSLPTATVGAKYAATLLAGGGTRPYTWSVAAGKLPAGLALSAAGVLSGLPKAKGNFTFTVKVRDVKGKAGPATSVSAKLTLSVT